MKKYGTHGVRFHGDDVNTWAAVLLRGESCSLIRTTNPGKLAGCDIRFDVGRRYNPTRGDFDHHQEGGAGVRSNGIPFAAFGLMWREFGAELCGSEDTASVMDFRYVQVIDAVDVGFDLFSKLNVPNVCPYTVSDIIANFNPPWNQKPKPRSEDFDRQFFVAAEVVKAIIQNEITLAKAVPEAREIIARATATDLSGRILILDENLPRREIMLEDHPNALFVVMPPENGGSWAVRCVEKSRGMSAVRRKLPASWAGKKGSELVRATGVPDAFFCHNTRFIATASTREGAIRLAELAIV